MFSMTVKAVGNVDGKLTKLAVEGTLFDIMLDDEEGDDWSFKDVVLTDCIITSATRTTATISGAPAATFSGFSLASKASPCVGNPCEHPVSRWPATLRTDRAAARGPGDADRHRARSRRRARPAAGSAAEAEQSAPTIARWSTTSSRWRSRCAPAGDDHPQKIADLALARLAESLEEVV